MKPKASKGKVYCKLSRSAKVTIAESARHMLAMEALNERYRDAESALFNQASESLSRVQRFIK